MVNVRSWYNGYQIGDTIIYNPWSIANYIQEKGQSKPYWVNTSDNKMIKDLLIRPSTNFKVKFKSLLQDNSIETYINDNFMFNSLPTSDSAIWSLLLMSGYLKTTRIKETEHGSLCNLLIPNKEIKGLHIKFIAE